MEDQLQLLEANLRETVKIVIWRVMRSYPGLRGRHDEVESAAYVGITVAHQSYMPDMPSSYVTWLRKKGYWATCDELRDSSVVVRRTCTRRQKLNVIIEADLQRHESEQGRAEWTCVSHTPATNSDPVELLMQEEELEDFRLLLTSLSSKERVVVEHYFFYGRTMKETGVEVGVCEGRVCQMLRDILKRLRIQFNGRLNTLVA